MGRARRDSGGAPAPGRRAYPERLGRWPAVAGLLVFTWIELVSGWGEKPRTLVIAVTFYTLLTLGAQARFGVENWSRRGETFGVYFNLLSRISPFESRDGVVGLRPPLGGLPKLDIVPGTIAFVLVMIGTVTFDGVSQGATWTNLRQPLEDALTNAGLDLQTTQKIAATVGLLACVGLVGGFYALGSRYAHRFAPALSTERVRRGFVHSLIPIALVYVAAHYLTFLIFEGQGIAYLASDPLGRGWDLFGTASSAIDYGLISQNQAWYLQVACVVAGHVAALMLAHDRALALYSQPRGAIRSQYAMLAIMVGFTTLALWLLAQAGTGT